MNNPNRPSFPLDPLTTDFDFNLGRTGLTKREYFAGLALQGILSNPINSHPDLMGVNAASNDRGFIASHQAAEEAVRYADELLKQLEK